MATDIGIVISVVAEIIMIGMMLISIVYLPAIKEREDRIMGKRFGKSLSDLHSDYLGLQCESLQAYKDMINASYKASKRDTKDRWC